MDLRFPSQWDVLTFGHPRAKAPLLSLAQSVQLVVDNVKEDDMFFVIAMELQSLDRQSRKFMTPRVRSIGLTYLQCLILGWLYHEPGQTQIELSEELGISAIALSQVLRKLDEDDKFIERRTDPKDRRARRLYLSEGARSVIEKLYGVVTDLEEVKVKGFTNDEKANLIELLRRMNTNLSEERAKSAGVSGRGRAVER